MNNAQKNANEGYFRMMLKLTRDGGQYIWPDENETFTVKGGKFYGTPRGAKKMRKITPKSFHKNIRG